MNLNEYRQSHPEYNQISDQDLAGALYQKYYSGKMSVDQFNAMIGLQPEQSVEVPQEEGFGSRLEREIRNVPRQAGLTARAAMEGIGEAAGIFSNPIAAGVEAITGYPMMSGGETMSAVADKIGLPSPETEMERVVNTGAKFMSPVGVEAGIANRVAQGATGAVKAVSGALASAPGAQLSGAMSGGVASGYTQETGGGPMAQFAAGMAGGFSGAMVPHLSRVFMDAATNLVANLRGVKTTVQQAGAALDEILAANGISVKDIAGPARVELIKEVRRAMDAGDGVNPDVVRRIADYALVGATPRRGRVTLDPVQLTQEKNLAKYGANSTDENLQTLARLDRENDMILTGQLNDMGASGASTPIQAGRTMQKALRSVDAPRKEAVDNAYQMVRDSEGRYANLDVPAFSKMANDALDTEMLGSVLPESVRSLLNDVSSGNIPLNVNTMAQLDRRLSGAIQTAYRGGDKDAALAVKMVRKALWETPVETAAGERALSLYDRARKMAAKRFKLIENNPAMVAALDNTDPDKFVQSYLTGGSGSAAVRNVKALAKDLKKVPEAYQAAREQILFYLKGKALNQNADELGNFSPSAYNKALTAIGEEKLSAFFTKSEVERMKAVGRVAGYEKFQPSGSAVNNSNTAAAFGGLIERVLGNSAVAKIPVLRVMASFAADHMKSQSGKRAARTALMPSITRESDQTAQYPSPFPILMPMVMGQE